MAFLLSLHRTQRTRMTLTLRIIRWVSSKTTPWLMRKMSAQCCLAKACKLSTTSRRPQPVAISTTVMKTLINQPTFILSSSVHLLFCSYSLLSFFIYPLWSVLILSFFLCTLCFMLKYAFSKVLLIVGLGLCFVSSCPSSYFNNISICLPPLCFDSNQNARGTGTDPRNQARRLH